MTDDYSILEDDCCPFCKTKLNASTPTTGADTQPSPDDYSICYMCAGLLKYDQSLKLIALPSPEFDALPDQTKHALIEAGEKIMAYRQQSRAM
jgi:hypothetical protein